MGWTHSWERVPELPKEGFIQAARDCLRIMAGINIPLGDEQGEGLPVFSDDEIAFNGAGDNCCEPFVFRRTDAPHQGRKRAFSFCKTERLPYDLCVQVALIVLKHHLGGEIIVVSDGQDDDWAKAREECQQILGYGQDFQLE